MEEYAKVLGLEKDAIELYFHCLGERPLTFKEIQSFMPHASVLDLNKIIEQLINQRLVVKIEPKHRSGITYFVALPPVDPVKKQITQIQKFLRGMGGNYQTSMQEAIKQGLETESPFDLSALHLKIQKIRSNFDQEAASIREELKELVDHKESGGFNVDFISKYEQSMKNDIQSAISEILVPLLHFKAEFGEKFKSLGITDGQWDAIKDEIKNSLSSKIHEKGKEITQILEQNFKTLKNEYNQNVPEYFKSQFEKESVYLGLLNLFKNELVKIDTLVHKSNETLQNVSQQLQKQIAKHLMESYEELITNYEGNIDSIVNVLEKAWKTLSHEEKIRREELFPVHNLHKLQEILGHLISGPYEELLVITPQIPELIPLEKLESLSKEMTLKIASTELHTNSLVKKLLQNEHIEYKRRQKDDFIGILADNTFLVMAYYEKDSKYPLRNIIGYATDHPPFIKLFENELRNKWTFARYEDRKEIEYNLNLIVENLNDYSGWKIGEILHEIIEIVQGMKGLSLNILEIKLLRNQLRKMNYCLDDDLKQEIVSKIKKFNKEVAQVDLEEPEIRLPKDAKPEVEIKEPIPAPREEDFLEEEFLQSEIELSQKMRRQPLEKKKLSPIKNKIPVQKESEDKHIDTASEIDKRSDKFEVLVKGIDSLAGSEISELLHEIIDEIIEREGFSMSLRGVKNWVTKLKRVQDPLGDQVKTEFMQDFSKLLEKYAPKLLKKEAEEGVPSFVALEEGSSEQKTPENSLGDKFNALIKNIEDKEGPALSSILQEISDDLLESQGAIAVRELRNWISKLRSIRSPLNAQMKAEFRNKIEIWRERFA